MILHDITKGVFESEIYKGDPKPEKRFIKSVDKDDEYTLSEICMCPHVGTHIDAPFHYFKDGRKIDEISIERFFGDCTVVTIQGVLTGEDMEKILPYCHPKVLLRSMGTACLSISAVYVLLDFGVELIGTDGVSIAYEHEESQVHRELLQNNVIILESLELSKVPDGSYILAAFPLKLSGLEAAPMRAVLLEQEKGI